MPTLLTLIAITYFSIFINSLSKSNNMMSFKALSLWCILLGLLQVSLGAVRYYKFDVEYLYRRPDCVEHVVMGINGQFPGPTIRAEVGDTLDIALTNSLFTEGTVIHWHGIRQYGTPWADGTASISQCVINPRETFNYRFKVDKAGTYFYHGHYGMQRSAGLYGSLIVDLPKGQKEPFYYDDEFNLLLSDWWHTSAHEQEVGLSSIPFKWVDAPQSFLINGRGQYNCSMAASLINTTLPQCKFKGGEECAPQMLHVVPGRTYRIRIASSTSLANLNLAIANHKMLVVEADGNYVEPFWVDDIDVYSGESYSVLITTNQNPGKNYWISVGARGENLNTPQALAILNYRTTTASFLPTSPPPITPRWDDIGRSKASSKKILAQRRTPRPPKYYDRRLLLLNTESLVDGYFKYAINNVTLALPSTPYLGAIKYKLDEAFDQRSPPDKFSRDYDIFNPPVNPNSTIGNGVYKFHMYQVIDVILQNSNVMEGKRSDIHPWHLHGHDFWVLGYGEGKFQQSDEAKFNLRNPPLRNTVVVFPYGWTALRFKATNPGVWAFHCHVEPHLHLGMGVIFAEAVENVEGIPKETLPCGIFRKKLTKEEYNLPIVHLT